MRECLAAARDGDFTRLVTFDMHRITRDGFQQLASVWGALAVPGLRVVEAGVAGAPEHDFAAMGPAQMVTALQSMLGAIDREKRARATRAGKRHHVTSGQLGCHGTPYALRWHADEGEFRWDAGQADVVREIYRRYLDGERAVDIAEDLRARGLPSPSQVAKTPKQAPWSASAVRRVLTNEAYRGIWRRWNKTHEQLLTPIIDEETWQAVVDRRASRDVRPGPIARKPPWLLDGVAVCARCGLPTAHEGSGKKYEYYRCAARRRRGDRKCHEPNSRRDQVEPQAWAIVVQLLTERWSELKEHVRAARVALDDDGGAAEQAVAQAKRQLSEVKRMLRMAEFHFHNGDWSDDEIREAFAPVKQLLAARRAAKADLAAAEATLAARDGLAPDVVASVDRLRELLIQYPDLAQRIGAEAEQRVVVTSLLEWIGGTFVVGAGQVRLHIHGVPQSDDTRRCITAMRGPILVLEVEAS